ncbi:DUF2184 domain-containing protein [Gracilibacillus oryzae]|uniref:DUF2184 domain-containing protein n=1 Tax=Gracilibacillus oryzae TaxID=1672701 RepID=A0A7C8GX00_9BACI|nr:DUF2184 domain-containing protein [Gracilibacillus oryzae]KAB8139272.1 DUF2184 domain-containing protein [Gracilibacillus oryzae]
MPQVNFQYRDLEAIDNTLYEPKYEELTARQILDVKSDVDPGAETYSYSVMTRSGAAKIMGNLSDDIPLVDVDMRRVFQRIYSIVTGFRYSVQELRNAQMANVPLETTKAGVARRVIAEKENKITWIGDAVHNIQGLANAEGIQTVAVEQGASASARWEDKTGKEIVADIRSLRAKVEKLPGHTVDTLVLPPDQYELLEEPYNEYNNGTIRNYIQNQNWFQSIVRAPELAGAGEGKTDAMLVLDSSREVVELLVPMDITRHDPEWAFPNYKFAVEERCGGTIIRYPMAIARGDGI